MEKQMFPPSEENMHWAVNSSICLGEYEPIVVKNRVSPVLTISEVVNFILTTRGDFLQIAVITMKPGAE